MIETTRSNNRSVAPEVPVWLRRLSWMLVFLVWPLIWIGGLVTTYDAGMSVPDWPNTYGYNLLLYPVETWLLGPFDLLIEHGHRLLAVVVGIVAIVFVVAAVREKRRGRVSASVVWLAGIVLAAVIGQGVLGGLRVVLDARTLAMVHGCTGPLFFMLCVVAACVTGRRWDREFIHATLGNIQATSRKTPGLIWPVGLIVLAACQLILGARLRHALPMTTASAFAHTAAMHVTLAFGVLLWTLGVVWRMRRCGDLTLSRPGSWLLLCVAVQIGLGIATWIVNYGYPAMLGFLPQSQSYLLASKNIWDSMIVTGHVAVGSLILGISTQLGMRVGRRAWVLKHMAQLGDETETAESPMQDDGTPALVPA